MEKVEEWGEDGKAGIAGKGDDADDKRVDLCWIEELSVSLPFPSFALFPP